LSRCAVSRGAPSPVSCLLQPEGWRTGALVVGPSTGCPRGVRPPVCPVELVKLEGNQEEAFRRSGPARPRAAPRRSGHPTANRAPGGPGRHGSKGGRVRKTAPLRRHAPVKPGSLRTPLLSRSAAAPSSLPRRHPPHRGQIPPTTNRVSSVGARLAAVRRRGSARWPPARSQKSVDGRGRRAPRAANRVAATDPARPRAGSASRGTKPSGACNVLGRRDGSGDVAQSEEVRGHPERETDAATERGVKRAGRLRTPERRELRETRSAIVGEAY